MNSKNSPFALSNSVKTVLPCLLLSFLLCPFLGSGQSFKKACRKYKKGKTERAEKIFRKYLDHEHYDLGSQYYLILIQSKKSGPKALKEWAKADSLLAALEAQYGLAGREKLLALKRAKAGKNRVANSRVRFQKLAIRLADRDGSVKMLDSVNRLFPHWVKKVETDWDTVRAHVVNRNLPTADYDVATSILNHHSDVVYKNHYRDVWTIREDIWEYFKKKYPLCKMQRFRQDHDWHYYARDCSFDAAKDMFCDGSLQRALDFHRQFPNTLFETEVIAYILEHKETNNTVFPSGDDRITHIHNLRQCARLLDALRQDNADSTTLYLDVDYYLKKYAPRLSAYFLLTEATNYYLRHDQPQRARRIMSGSASLFPDSSACSAFAEFETQKQAWLKKFGDCLNAQPAEANPCLETPWNTRTFSEFSAVSWEDGQEVYFAQQEGKKTRVMRSVPVKNGWEEATPVPALSVSGKAIPLSMTADGLQMLLKVGKYLYVSTRADEFSPWVAPRKLSVSFPGMRRAVFSPDGSAIIGDAILDKPTVWTKPTAEICYSLLGPDGQYGKIRKMGRTINTDANEVNPYFCADDKTLLFCSDRQDGYGKLDVFVAHRLDSTWSAWSTPENLGCGVNTGWDEYGYTWVPEDGKKALLSSIVSRTQDRNIKQADLPAFARPQPRSRLKVVLLTMQGKPVSSGNVVMASHVRKVPVKMFVSASGRCTFPLPDRVDTIALSADAPEYFTMRDTTYALNGRPGTTIRDTFRMLSLKEVQQGFQLKYATFDPQGTKLNDPRVYKELDLLQRFSIPMKARVYFIGHTDSVGTASYNLTLSQQRAEAIRQYMIDQFGMPKDNVFAEGRGETQPKCSNATSEGRHCNRRVEVRIEIPPAEIKKRARETYEMKKKDKETRAQDTGGGGSSKTDIKPKPKPRPKPGPPVLEQDETPRKTPRKWWKKLIFWKREKNEEEAEEDDPSAER